MRLLQHRRLVQQLALGEARRAKHLDIIYNAGLAVKDQVGQHFPGRRSVHHAVAAESVGAEKTLPSLDRPDDAVMVGRHLVQSGPGALGIDRQILEAGHAIGGARQNLLDERRLEVGVEARRLLGIVPRQQEAEALRAEVKAVASCR